MPDSWEDRIRQSIDGEVPIELPHDLADRVRQRLKTRRDRTRRLQAAAVGSVVGLAAWLGLSMNPAPAPEPVVAPVIVMDEETKQLIADIHAKLDRLNAQLDSWEEEQAALQQESTLDEEAKDTAFKIIHSGAVLDKLDGDHETAAFAYRSVMTLYAGTIWADVARQQLEQMTKPEVGRP